MDLLDDESHRLLLWAVRLHEVGHVPTRRELRQVAEPRRAAGLAVVTGLTGRADDYREGAITSLIRRGLLEESGDHGVAPTELGRRVVQVLELEGGAQPMFEVLDVDLRASDPLGFARVVGRIAGMHRPMVVDPTCARSELEYQVAHSTVSRVLVSDRLGDDELDDLVDSVGSIRNRDVKLRLRVGPAEDLWDRCVIGEERVLQVGGLPAQAGGGTTVLVEVHDLDEAARRHYDRVWKDADRLAVYKPDRGAAARVA
jgi:hypothetical protein